MTKNTLAAGIMAGVVGGFAGIIYLSTAYADIMALVLMGCLAAMGLACFWFACQDLARSIEARRKRGEGTE